MTNAVQALLKAFDALSDEEKHAAAAEVLRRSPQFASTDLSEETFVAVAEQLFLDLDSREASDRQS
jgi:hypothetical protein